MKRFRVFASFTLCVDSALLIGFQQFRVAPLIYLLYFFLMVMTLISLSGAWRSGMLSSRIRDLAGKKDIGAAFPWYETVGGLFGLAALVTISLGR